MRKRISIKALQAFEAAARLGSFALAAEDLAVTPSAISHQIKLLEEQLGVRLFERVHRSVVLTEPGRLYAAEVTGAFARIEAATQNVANAGAGAVLTVHCSPSLATQWLMRRLARYNELHPELDIRLHASVAPADLTQGVVDVDIRYDPPPPAAGLVMTPFPDDTVVPMCAPALAQGLRPIQGPEDLGRHTLIHSEVTMLGWPDWAKRHRKARLDMDRGPRFDRSFMAISAAADGLGICLDTLTLAEQELKTGKLVVPFPTEGVKVTGHGFYTLRSKADLPKIRDFREWIMGEVAKTCAWAEAFLAGMEAGVRE